jgi:FdhD protein
MEQNRQHVVVHYDKGSLTSVEQQVVQEYPLRLEVNGRELAILIASPHQLNFLVAGFLRLQGFIKGLDDIQSLGVCSEFGAARVRIRGEIPERLTPTLTSGCGTGISFQLPAAPMQSVCSESAPVRFAPEQIFTLMQELAQRAENYRAHGGIHSAAVGDGQQLLLYSEDLGRHNTLDRLAGEALFKKIDLHGTLLVTSGRVSTEMVAKAAQLGIVMIASRTSPTDMAVKIAEQAGVALIGYVRGHTFDVYSHAHLLLAPVTEPTCPSRCASAPGSTR